MNYTKQLNAISEAMQNDICEQVNKIGKQSNNYSKVITIDKKTGLNFNLDHNQYLTEVTEKGLISQYGHIYDFSNITTGELAELTDYIKGM